LFLPMPLMFWLKKKAIDRGIKKENMYGMDESGFPPLNQGTECIVGRQGAKMQHKLGNANHKNVTALVTICADGTALKPTIIFKGQNFLKDWGKDNVVNASYAKFLDLKCISCVYLHV
jgi:hypothetical protein